MVREYAPLAQTLNRLIARRQAIEAMGWRELAALPILRLKALQREYVEVVAEITRIERRLK